MKSRDLIAARPHFRLTGSDLRFFLSERVFHSMDAREASLWKKLQEGPLSAQDVDDATAVESLARAGVVEVIEPVPTKARRRILVVEPHCDDAALSIGGTMWKMREQAEFQVLTMASRSNYTSSFQLRRNCFDRSEITQMRAAEGELFVKHLGGQYFCADMAEATLRYNDADWNLGFFNDHEVAVANFNNRRAETSVLNDWIERLDKFLSNRSFDEIWIPLGAGTHSDHDLARNASLEVAMRNRPDAVIRLYEDVPYGGEFPEHSERVLRLLRDAGALLNPWAQDITKVFPKKLALLSIFASQFKVSSIQPGVEQNAGAEAGPKKENLWTVEALPRALDREKMWFGSPDIANTARKLPQFLRGARKTRRVAVFAINAAGRWNHDLELLTSQFPRARFIIYAGPRVVSEFTVTGNALVDLRPINRGSIAWMKAAIREFWTSHRIVIAGQALGKAKTLVSFWPVGRSIIVAQMDHFTEGLPLNRS